MIACCRAAARRYNGFFHKVLPKAQVAVTTVASLYAAVVLLTSEAQR